MHASAHLPQRAALYRSPLIIHDRLCQHANLLNDCHGLGGPAKANLPRSHLCDRVGWGTHALH